MYTSSRNRC